jgi:hypothetical protein
MVRGVAQSLDFIHTVCVCTPPPALLQVVLVSATLPNEVLQMTQQFMTDPVRILVKRDELTLEVWGAVRGGLALGPAGGGGRSVCRHACIMCAVCDGGLRWKASSAAPQYICEEVKDNGDGSRGVQRRAGLCASTLKI